MPRDAEGAADPRVRPCAARTRRTTSSAPTWAPTRPAWRGSRTRSAAPSGCRRAIGGIPLDEIGATGWGLRHAAEVAAPYCNLDLQGARVAIQGFGAVGKHARASLPTGRRAGRGVRLDGHDRRSRRARRRADLIALKDAGKSVCDYPDGEKLDRDAILDVECDIWIPAARPDVMREDNVARLQDEAGAAGRQHPVHARRRADAARARA